MKIKTLGVTFRGASAYYVQKSIAPQKQAVCRFSDDFFFSDPYVSGIAFYRRARGRPRARTSDRPPRPALMRVRLLALLMAAGLESLPDARLALGVAPGSGPQFLA